MSDDDRTHSSITPHHFSRICHRAIDVLPAPSDRLADLKPLAAEGLAITPKGQPIVVAHESSNG